jgi:hypothetical protein
LNNKTLIQCTIENTSNKFSMEIKDIDLQLTKTNFLKKLESKYSKELIENLNYTSKDLLNNNSFDFNKNCDKSLLPITLDPFDKFNFNFQLNSNSNKLYFDSNNNNNSNLINNNNSTNISNLIGSLNEYETLINVDYKIIGINSILQSESIVKWRSIINEG